MSDERKPVESVSELDALDDRDVLSGYEAGRNGREEPSIEFNRSYWHGWRNGMMDSGRMKGEAASAKLAHDAIESGWLTRLSTRDAKEWR